MEKSDKINELLASLNEFQNNQKPITKDSKNPFLKNKYASLDVIVDQTKECLHKNGLSFSQLVTDEGVNTYLFHKSGQFISTGFKKIEIQVTKGLSIAQAEGVAITYTKRYQLGGVLGISTDEDTDGQYSDNKELETKKKNETDELVEALKEIEGCEDKEQLQAVWSKHKKFQTHETFKLKKDNLKNKLS